MPRAARVLVLVAGIGAGAIVSGAGATWAAPPPTPPPVTTPGATATTLATVVTATPTTLPAGSRGGATEGSVAKPESETWSPRRIATMTVIAVVALAVIGYAYGKLRSVPPRHPDLTRRTPDLDADALEARN